MTLLQPLVPPGVIAVELREDPEGDLFPEEQAAVACAVEKRRVEFRTGRLCARRALTELGQDPAPLLVGPRGQPLWPAGVVGSITHCAGYRAAACAPRGALPSIGIDAEPNEPLPAGVLPTISLASERALVEDLGRRPAAVAWDRLLFSAKESVYKAWYPLCGEPLEFEDARISIGEDGTLSARLLRSGLVIDGRRVDELTGRWGADRSVVVTMIAVEPNRVR